MYIHTHAYICCFLCIYVFGCVHTCTTHVHSCHDWMSKSAKVATVVPCLLTVLNSGLVQYYLQALGGGLSACVSDHMLMLIDLFNTEYIKALEMGRSSMAQRDDLSLHLNAC